MIFFLKLIVFLASFSLSFITLFNMWLNLGIVNRITDTPFGGTALQIWNEFILFLLYNVHILSFSFFIGVLVGWMFLVIVNAIALLEKM